MKNPDIAAYIAERMRGQEEAQVASADEVLRFFSSVMRGEVRDQFGLEAALSDRLNAGRELMKRWNAARATGDAGSVRICRMEDGGIEVDDGA